MNLAQYKYRVSVVLGLHLCSTVLRKWKDCFDDLATYIRTLGCKVHLLSTIPRLARHTKLGKLL